MVQREDTSSYELLWCREKIPVPMSYCGAERREDTSSLELLWCREEREDTSD